MNSTRSVSIAASTWFSMRLASRGGGPREGPRNLRGAGGLAPSPAPRNGRRPPGAAGGEPVVELGPVALAERMGPPRRTRQEARAAGGQLGTGAVEDDAGRGPPPLARDD